ncbi:MAG TPA: hypothetical protein V6C69_01460 [Trichormus sp.]|jgi:hypothetical protein
MDRIFRTFGLTVLLGLITMTIIVSPASAISVELAKKCRDMAIKTHPPTVPGAKKGSAEAERVFYQSCITNGENRSNDDTPQGPSSSPK